MIKVDIMVEGTGYTIEYTDPNDVQNEINSVEKFCRSILRDGFEYKHKDGAIDYFPPHRVDLVSLNYNMGITGEKDDS